ANRRTLTEIFTEMHHVLKQNTAKRAAAAVAQVIDARRVRA
ncbi:MAG TPA: lipid-A-disaccharide synthase, partial [Paraburkholderia sp.]